MPVLEEVPADVVDLLVVGERYLDDREAGGVGSPDAHLVQGVEHVGVMRHRSARRSPRVRLTSNPASVVASEATGDGPEYR